MIYQSIARIYDDLMEHVPYRRWAEFIAEVLLEHNAAPGKTLDAACGTGRFLEEFSRFTPLLYGFDQSTAMLKQATDRLASRPMPVHLSTGEIETWNESDGFNLIVCLYDSINYLTTPKRFRRGLTNLSQRLTENGLFIFDVCTEKNSLKNFLHYREEDVAAENHYVRTTWFDEETRIQHNRFFLEPGDGSPPLTEHHLQRIYSLDEVRRMLQDTSLEILGEFSGMSLRPGSEDDDRVHFLVRRRRS